MRSHTLRTVILTVVGTLIVGIVAIYLIAWGSSSTRSVATQGVSSISYGVSKSNLAIGGGVMSSDAGMPSAAPEMYPSRIATSPAHRQHRGRGQAPAIGAKIIRTGNLDLRVDDAAKKIEDAKALASQFGGFVDSSSLVDNGGVKTGYVTIRVPSDKYDELVTPPRSLPVLVLSENSNSQDVTAQFVALDARLKAAQAEEAQYMDILKQAKTVEDTLKVTDALSEVRTTIEQLQGQLRYLRDKTDYSTLTISLTEETRIQAPTKLWQPLETIRQTFQGLVIVLQSFVDFLIGLAIYGIGFILPILLIVWLIYRLVEEDHQEDEK